MNKNLLRIGGAINLLFVAFHLAQAKPIGQLPLPSDILATVSTLNIQVVFALLIFAYFSIFRCRDLLTTRLGHLLAVAIALFWFLRGAAQLIYYGRTAADMPLFILCLVFGLLYLVPVLREWNNVGVAATAEVQPPSDRHAESLPASQERIGRTPWTAYAAVAWCLLFGGLHLYWALGGMAGFAAFSMPSNRVLALTRAPIYMGITWGVVVGCVVGIIVALAPFQSWTRRIPLWMLLTPLWIACGLFILRGTGNPIQSALIVGGGMPFQPLASSEAPAWYQWLLIDAVIYSPWFILGGLAFGATAWIAGRRGDAPAKRELVSAAPA